MAKSKGGNADLLRGASGKASDHKGSLGGPAKQSAAKDIHRDGGFEPAQETRAPSGQRPGDDHAPVSRPYP